MGGYYYFISWDSHLVTTGDSTGQIWIHTFSEETLKFTHHNTSCLHQSPILSIEKLEIHNMFCSGSSDGKLSAWSIDLEFQVIFFLVKQRQTMIEMNLKLYFKTGLDKQCIFKNT